MGNKTGWVGKGVMKEVKVDEGDGGVDDGRIKRSHGSV